MLPFIIIIENGELRVEKEKKERFEVFVDYYSLIICRSSGNRCGWFSKKFRDGVLIAFVFALPLHGLING